MPDTLQEIGSKYAMFNFQMSITSLISDRLQHSWRWEQLNNKLFDWYYRTDTHRETLLVDQGVPEPFARTGNTIYRPFPAIHFRQIIKSIPTDLAHFTFVDVGSGKGKVLLLASEFSFAKIIGIEYAPGLHRVALNNILRFKATSGKLVNITSINANALDWGLPAEPAVYFINNSFDESITGAFFLRIEKQIIRSGTPTILIYANIRDVREREQQFKILKSFTVLRRTKHDITFSHNI